MQFARSLLAAATLLGGLAAQHHDPSTLATATDFGLAVKTATGSSRRITAKGSKIDHVLWLGLHSGSSAWVSTTVSKTESTAGKGVRVKEQGQAGGGHSGAATAGTIAGTGSEIGALHAVVWSTPLGSGTKGKLTVTWTSTASTGSAAAATVSVNGKQVASFTARNSNATATFDVVADAKGIRVLVATRGVAPGTKDAKAAYSSSIGAFFKSATSGGGCTFHAQGRPCNRGGTLSGSATATGLTLRLAGARPSTAGILFLGRLRTAGIRLPGGGCLLRVSEIPLLVRTGAGGSVAPSFDVPPALRPLSFSAQAALVWTDARRGLRVGSSNTVTATCAR